MSWLKKSIRGVDLSYFQAGMDVSLFVESNPSVEFYLVRAVWPNGQTDQCFGRIYDTLVNEGQTVGAYLWPNPIISLAKVKTNWERAIDGRKLAWVAVDIEWSQTDWKNSVGAPIRTITEDTRQSLRMATDMFGENVLIYTSGGFWDANIREHGWEKDYKFWVPNYPTPFQVKPDEWRQCATFEECNQAVIGTTRYAGFPRLGEWIPPENVVGWQFSDHGRLPGYAKNIDLDLWLEEYIAPTPTPNWDDIDMLERMDILRQLADSHGLI